MGQVDIPRELYSNCRLMISTPMYGGLQSGRNALETYNLMQRLGQAGVASTVRHIYHESLIPRARNKAAADFLASDYTDLLFLDADIVFTPDDVLLLLAYARGFATGEPMQVVGAPYAKKQFDWEAVKRAVLEHPEIPAEALPMVACKPVVGWLTDARMRVDEPAEVRELGTGMLLVGRDVFTTLARQFPELEYAPMADEAQQPSYDFFGVGRNPTPPHNYLSEDYWFERLWRSTGGKVWLCPWMVTRHIGTQEFPCDIGTRAKYVSTI